MKALIRSIAWVAVALLALVATAQPGPAGWATNAPAPSHKITDLGVITATSLIELTPGERRKDFNRFKIEILPRNARGWTNKVQIVTTNKWLKLDDLIAVPEGVAIMGVRSICNNGDASAVALYRIDVQRDLPDAPTASVSHILRMPTEQKIEHVIDAIQTPADAPAPPMPAGMTNPAVKSAVPTRSYQPLPSGSGTSYAHYQWMLEQAATRGMRRSGGYPDTK